MEHFSPETNWRLVGSLPQSRLWRKIHTELGRKGREVMRLRYIPQGASTEEEGNMMAWIASLKSYVFRAHTGHPSPGIWHWEEESFNWIENQWNLKTAVRNWKTHKEYTCLLAPWCKVEELDWNCLGLCLILCDCLSVFVQSSPCIWSYPLKLWCSSPLGGKTQ